jgi:O-antigen ligase
MLPENAAPGQLPAAANTPLQLGASLALAALAALPLADGGYSGAGYLIALVLLPLALALCWPAIARRPWQAQAALLAYLGAGLALPVISQPGRELWSWLLPLPLGWCAAWVILDCLPQRRGLLLPLLACAAGTTAVWGLALWLLSGSLATRLSANFGLPNAYAGFLLLAWPATALAALYSTPRWRVVLSGVLLCLLAAFVLTYSRAGWCVLALQLCALSVLHVIHWSRSRRTAAQPGAELPGSLPSWVLYSVPALLLALLALPSVREVLARALDFGGYSMTGRRRFWEAALAMWRDHPWTGIGLGNFGSVYPQYQHDPWWYSVDPHSWPLQLLCEWGIPGALLAVALLVGIAVWLRRIWRALPAFEVALLSVAVLGSLAHAAVDFDYTFGATTGLLGVLLAWGSWRAAGDASGAQPSPAASAPLPLAWLSSAALAAVAIWGVGFTAERYCLDRLRDTPGLADSVRLELLKQAVHANPRNAATHYRLASLLAQQGGQSQVLAELDTALRLSPRYALALALRGLIKGPGSGEADLARALELDQYNYPEHYFYYATLARDDAVRRQRLLDGLAKIQVSQPVTPEDIRSDWVKLNPVFARWYYELARLSTDEHEAQSLRQTAARFEQYAAQRQREQQEKQSHSPGTVQPQGDLPEASST